MEQLRKDLWLPTSKEEFNVCSVNNNVHSKLCYQGDAVNNSGEVASLREKYSSKVNPERETLKTFSISLAPNAHQKTKLGQMLVLSNLGFNWAKWLIDEKGFSPKDKGAIQKVLNKKSLDDISDKTLIYPEAFKYAGLMRGTTAIRTTGMHQYFSAYKASMRLHKGNEKKFNIRYREINSDRGTIGLPKPFIQHVTEKDLKHGKGRKDYDERKMLKIMPDFFGQRDNPENRFIKVARLASAKKMPPFEHDVTINLRPNGKWILNIPCESKYIRVTEKTDHQKNPVVSSDPGVRAFQTMYDPFEQKAWQMGTQEDLLELRKLKTRAQHFDSLAAVAKKKGQAKAAHDYERAAAKTWRKLKDVRHNKHRLIASDMVRNYQSVVVGKLSSSSCVYTKNGRKLSRQTNSDMHTWSPYTFQQRLHNRANGTTTFVMDQDEAYTSKTCGRCGKINKKLGSSKTFECQCGTVIDRDVNGARNILVKNAVQ